MQSTRPGTLGAIASIAFAAGCGASDDATITGQLALDTFASTPSGIVAVDGDGEEVSAAQDAAGAFSLVVPDEATYRLYIALGDERVPIALRNTDTGWGATLRIGMGGPTIDVGTLRYAATTAAEALTVTDETLPVEDTCVDGVSSASGAACIGGDASIVCEDGDAAEAGMHGGRRGRHGGKGRGESVGDVELTDAPAVVVPTVGLPLDVGCGC